MNRITRQPTPAVKAASHHATCSAEFSPDQTEFLMAIDAFKTTTGKRFPTWVEVMRVFESLGYRKCQCGQCKPCELESDPLYDCEAELS
jgi:hypothetical protein